MEQLWQGAEGLGSVCSPGLVPSPPPGFSTGAKKTKTLRGIQEGAAASGPLQCRGKRRRRRLGRTGQSQALRQRLCPAGCCPCALGHLFTAFTARPGPLRALCPLPARPRPVASPAARGCHGDGPAVIDGSDSQSAPCSANPAPRRQLAGTRQTRTTRPSMLCAGDAAPEGLWGAGHDGVCRRQAAAVPSAARPSANTSTGIASVFAGQC